MAFDYLKSLEQKLYYEDGDDKIFRGKPFVINMNGEVIPEWLYPDTASFAFDCPLDSFIVTKQASGMFQFKPNLAGRKLLYRGQIKEYPSCVPNLFRNKDQDYFLTENILCHEMWEVIKTHPLFQLLSLQGVRLLDYPFKMYLNFGGISQHYYNKTTFLDLTSDIDTAKFFACCECKNNVYSAFCSDELGVIYFFVIKHPSAFQPLRNQNGNRFHLSTIGKQVFPRSGAHHGFLLEMSKGLDFEDIPITGKVYFKHNNSVSEKILTDSQNGRKYMPESPLDMYWQEKLSNTRTDRTVSRAAVVTNRSMNPHETMSSLSKKLIKRGFTISNKSPKLEERHLEMYYQDIKNGWWADKFCSDIYFYGEDGVKYQEAFRNLASVPDYQWAFRK